MANGFYTVPKAVNEQVRDYVPGSDEHNNLMAMYKKMYKEDIDIPLYIGKEEIRTGKIGSINPPHDHKHSLGQFHQADQKHIEEAISIALKARKKWATTPWEERAAIFLRAAELLSGPYRDKMNAATMLAQSKNLSIRIPTS